MQYLVRSIVILALLIGTMPPALANPPAMPSSIQPPTPGQIRGMSDETLTRTITAMETSLNRLRSEATTLQDTYFRAYAAHLEVPSSQTQQAVMEALRATNANSAAQAEQTNVLTLLQNELFRRNLVETVREAVRDTLEEERNRFTIQQPPAAQPPAAQPPAAQPAQPPAQPQSYADRAMGMAQGANTQYLLGLQQLRAFITAPVGDYTQRERMSFYYEVQYPGDRIRRYLMTPQRHQNLMDRLLENEEAARSGLSQIEPAEFLRRLADLEAELVELQQENAMFSDEQGQPETGIANLIGFLRNQIRQQRLLAERFTAHGRQLVVEDARAEARQQRENRIDEMLRQFEEHQGRNARDEASRQRYAADERMLDRYRQHLRQGEWQDADRCQRQMMQRPGMDARTMELLRELCESLRSHYREASPCESTRRPHQPAQPVQDSAEFTIIIEAPGYDVREVILAHPWEHTVRGGRAWHTMTATDGAFVFDADLTQRNQTFRMGAVRRTNPGAVTVKVRFIRDGDSFEVLAHYDQNRRQYVVTPEMLGLRQTVRPRN